MPDVPAVPDAVGAVLERARTRHLLGPTPLDEQVAHAFGFVAVAAPPARWLDLGSGGGLPGLVLAAAWPGSSGVLLDSARRRAGFLVEAVDALGWADRVSVVHGRAEDVGRELAYRGTFDLVVARSFGPPAVTAECGAPFLRVGGLLVVSEPPVVASASPGGGPERWPADALEVLGLTPGPTVRGRFGYQVLRQVMLCPDRFPRRPGVPTRRPLYTTSTAAGGRGRGAGDQGGNSDPK